MADWLTALSNAAAGDYGIIGDPVEHSLSPQMHEPAFAWLWKEQRRPGGVPKYHRFHVPAADLARFLVELRKKKLGGVNVTVPHKEGVLGLLDRLDHLAKAAGGVNTIRFDGAALSGYNTDGYGFMQTIAQVLKADPRVALVLGAGATGKLIAHHLAMLGPRKIYVWNRNRERAMSVRDSMPKDANVEVIDASRVGAASREADLIANATSVGLGEKDGLPVEGLVFTDKQRVFDVVYHRPTELLKSASAAGARACGGLPMLLYQGAQSFSVWTGAEAPVELMKKALLKAVAEKGMKPVWPSAT